MPEDPKKAGPETAEKKAAADPKTSAYRKRQSRAAKIIEKVFGPFRASNPRRWEERTYMMLLGTVYEMLVAEAKTITRDELSTIARILAEGRKSPVKAAKSTAPAREKPAKSAKRGAKASGAAKNATADDGKKNQSRLRESVAELYGTDAEGEKS